MLILLKNSWKQLNGINTEPEIMTNVQVRNIAVMKRLQLGRFKNPMKAINVAMNGPKTNGPMAKEIDLSNSETPNSFLILMYKKC